MQSFDDFYSALRGRIRRLRTERGLLQTGLEEAGISQSTLQQVEQGTRIARLDTIYRFAVAFKMTPAELLDLSDESTANEAPPRGGRRPKGKPVKPVVQTGRRTSRSRGRR